VNPPMAHRVAALIDRRRRRAATRPAASATEPSVRSTPPGG
jgi:hypothetical protein